jgi:hypothetical protein
MVAKARVGLHSDGTFKLLPTWGKCISVLGDYVEKLRYLNEISKLHLTL